MDAAYSYQLLRAREVNQRVRWARLLETRVRQDLDLLTPWLSAHGFLLLHIPRFSGSPARLHSEICPPDRGPTISIRNRHRLGHERPCPIAARRHPTSTLVPQKSIAKKKDGCPWRKCQTALQSKVC